MATLREIYNQTVEDKENVSRPMFNRLMLLTLFALRKKDGSPTKFAKRFGIDSPAKLYRFLKDVKKDLKNDREVDAFYKLTELSKSAFGRMRHWLEERYREDLEDDPGRAAFAAHVFIMRTFGFALDNLNSLKAALKRVSFDDIAKAAKGEV